jgi:hypothetical protein
MPNLALSPADVHNCISYLRQTLYFKQLYFHCKKIHLTLILIGQEVVHDNINTEQKQN